VIVLESLGETKITITGRVTDQNGQPIKGVGINLCRGYHTQTGDDGRFYYNFKEGHPYCVRIVEDTLPPGYIKIVALNSLTEDKRSYEHQRAGMDCRANPHGCSEGERKYDLPRDDIMDFKVYLSTEATKEPLGPSITENVPLMIGLGLIGAMLLFGKK